MNIWRLWVGGKANLALIPHNLEYFSNHFIGERLGDAWTPPPVSINGKSKKLRDFVSWMERARVSSFFLREEQLSVPTPRIFKLSHERNSIFVSNNFADVVIDNKLTGLALVDPRKNIYKINALGGDLNDVAGVKQ